MSYINPSNPGHTDSISKAVGFGDLHRLEIAPNRSGTFRVHTLLLRTDRYGTFPNDLEGKTTGEFTSAI